MRDSVRARLKILVRRTLQRYKYPPDKAAEAGHAASRIAVEFMDLLNAV
ncbi:MAG: DUF3387 domain-containing protein [Methylobacter sp.]|nr:DUF3387 domain-containing protein [Methylobacter sp.]